MIEEAINQYTYVVRVTPKVLQGYIICKIIGLWAILMADGGNILKKRKVKEGNRIKNGIERHNMSLFRYYFCFYSNTSEVFNYFLTFRKKTYWN